MSLQCLAAGPRAARLILAPFAFALATAASAEGADSSEAGFDVRLGKGAPAAEETLSEPLAELRHELGPEGVLDLDPTTDTARVVADRDGSLTPPSAAAPEDIALGYVAENRPAFGLSDAEVANLDLARSYTSNGITHLTWAQEADGIPVVGADIRATVAEDGRLVSVGGAPVPDLGGPSTNPQVSAASAAEAGSLSDSKLGGVRSVSGSDSETIFRDGSRAYLVLFPTEDGAELAWRTFDSPSSALPTTSVVDASSGEVLRRASLASHATGLAYDHYPGAPAGGTQQTKTFPETGNDPWLTTTSQLKGNNALAYSDPDDDIFSQMFLSGPSPLPGQADLVPPSSGTAWNYAQQNVTSDNPSQNCPPSGCTWAAWDEEEDAFSWEPNREQAATQAFYFINNFHDHLRDAAGIGFTEATGNFEQTNSSGKGKGKDPVHVQVMNGADTGDTPQDDFLPSRPGFPNDVNMNNANALVYPEGFSMRIQAFLFTAFDYDDELDMGFHHEVLNDVNAIDSAPLIYHEYGHGFSHRSITDADGTSGIGDGEQSRAMGEAWSDWYAEDYLVAQNLQPDTAANGEVWQVPYVGIQPTGGNYRGRSEPMDCPVGSGPPACPGSNWGDEFEDPEFNPEIDAGVGGYTFGDFGKIHENGSQVHHNGEIWGQTLWDLRRRLLAAHPSDGLQRARALVTEGMRIAPSEPSYLDARNAILIADSALGYDDHNLIWDVFAERGMGVEASTFDAYDFDPVEDFDEPTDGVDPETTIDALKVTHAKRKAKVTFSGTDPAPASLPLSFRCRVDAKPFDFCTSPNTFKKLKPGQHTVEVIAYDDALNADPSAATRTFKVKK